MPTCAETFLGPACAFLEPWLVRPILVLPLMLVMAVLFGLGKGLGLPGLFWSKNRVVQLQAGFGVALLFFETVLVLELLEGPESIGPIRSFAYTAAVLGALLVAFAGYRASRPRRSQPGVVSPAIRAVDAESKTPGPREQPGVPPWAFFGGIVLGAATAAGLALGSSVIPTDAIASVLRFLDRPSAVPELHGLAAVGFALSVLGFIRPPRVPASLAICSFGGYLVGLQGLLTFFLGLPGLEIFVLVAALAISGLGARRIRFPELADRYDHPVPYPPAGAAAPPGADPFRPVESLGGKAPRRLILVCASGGGIRSATWTAAILGRLSTLPPFRSSTRWISGASGGMVGAAFWRAAQGQLDHHQLARVVSSDSLSPVVRQLVFRDVPLAFIPFSRHRDRGRALQEAWADNLASLVPKGAPVLPLSTPIARLAGDEARGEWPFLVFSPMLVEDGRRLIVSNLDLSSVTDHQVRWLSHLEPGPPPTTSTAPVTSVASRSAYALAELDPGCLDRMQLGTAARMSASFPFVSPAVALPTDPERRVVDAGYYDNYGVELACSWLRLLLQRHRDELRARLDGILVIQIRDNVSELSVTAGAEPASEKPSVQAPKELQRIRDRGAERPRLFRGFEGLTSPLEGVLSARESVMLFRNDAQLEAAMQLYTAAFGSEDFLMTTNFEFAGEASLSWHLSEAERELLVTQAEAQVITDKIAAIGEWLARPRKVAGQVGS